jgi:hypothetical protein
MCTFPTAASPNKTSLTLLLGFGALGAEVSAMVDVGGGVGEGGRLARRLLPTLYEDTLAP